MFELIYLAGRGIVSALGTQAAMTIAGVKAEIVRYKVSGYYTEDNQPITMAGVPKEVFAHLEDKIDQGNYYSGLYDHVIKMALIALREAVANYSLDKPIPLIMAMPEVDESIDQVSASSITNNLVERSDLPLSREHIRYIYNGRAAGIEALELAFRYLYEAGEDYVLVGGSDSYWHYPIIAKLSAADRVLAPATLDGFAAGEGAGFLLLTRDPAKAMVHKGKIVGIHHPGSAEETGHLHSDQPYLGEGLDKAFKQALGSEPKGDIATIYSSMNGERFWAKEYGVAMTRNQQYFSEQVRIEHPADYYGDLGAATGPVLIALAADNMLCSTGQAAHLVYASSDYSRRSAVKLASIAHSPNHKHSISHSMQKGDQG
ncbi:beta-ketoacyl synthase N-terminal-like domain-containing protein [Agarilytica rhodophyticola]|uniref:beta-ketoacyl synthase N-terminal-like domain-containing protein n=1 Tax=Agarilytica rhodophyticola TaxID=1737490 RepID=UPI000B34989E|nr:beta-ketoacyl synthase N-terminal-like domain-containing protein [Agarilytica rhodophyticola]